MFSIKGKSSGAVFFLVFLLSLLAEPLMASDDEKVGEGPLCSHCDVDLVDEESSGCMRCGCEDGFWCQSCWTAYCFPVNEEDGGDEYRCGDCHDPESETVSSEHRKKQRIGLAERIQMKKEEPLPKKRKNEDKDTPRVVSSSGSREKRIENSAADPRLLSKIVSSCFHFE
jgi:hypothetical protein